MDVDMKYVVVIETAALIGDKGRIEDDWSVFERDEKGELVLSVRNVRGALKSAMKRAQRTRRIPWSVIDDLWIEPDLIPLGRSEPDRTIVRPDDGRSAEVCDDVQLQVSIESDADESDLRFLLDSAAEHGLRPLGLRFTYSLTRAEPLTAG